MKAFKHLLLASIFLFTLAPAVMAGEYGWLKDMNVKAEADPSGFRARLGARFKINDIEVEAVLSNVNKPADAYMVLRMGEMSGHSTDFAMNKYKANQGKGWGTIAKSMGIKPGSSEFHALKQGQDLYANGDSGKNKRRSKDKNKSKKQKY
jgi:hypothetical protein